MKEQVIVILDRMRASLIGDHKPVGRSVASDLIGTEGRNRGVEGVCQSPKGSSQEGIRLVVRTGDTEDAAAGTQ